MKKFLKLGAVALALTLAVFAPSNPLTQTVSAQTSLQATTTSAAVNATTKTVNLTSGTQVAVGSFLFVDREQMVVIDATSTTAPLVQRGQGGTKAAAHASGAVVYVGVASRFYSSDVAGTCTATSELFLPHINPATGNVFNCYNSTWQRIRAFGIPNYTPAVLSQTYTSSGAIDVQPGIVFINGTTLAMTIVDPTTDQNGMIMVIESTNASAHTVTYTAGFNGGTTARDVATFGGAIGDNFVIFANNKVWWVISTRNVTFG